MYFKDYLLFIVNECVTTSVQSTFITNQSNTLNCLHSFDLQTKEYEKNGNLLSYLKIGIPFEIHEKIKQIVLVFDTYVFDLGIVKEEDKEDKDDKDDKDEDRHTKDLEDKQHQDGEENNKKIKKYTFASLEKYPFPLYELQDTPSKFSLHILFDTPIVLNNSIIIEMKIHTPNDIKVISKIPKNWTLSIEPSWNESKLKLEKNNNFIQICDSPGWIPFQIYYDYLKKNENDEDESFHDLNNSDSDTENSNDSLKSKENAFENFRLGLMENNELSNDLQTQKYLGIYPLNDNEKMHLYFQWKSLRTILNNKINECT